MNKLEASQILACWLASSKGTEKQLGYIEGWFKTSEKLPAVGESVLLSNGVWTAEGCYRADGRFDVWLDCSSDDVIAWKPLPEDE